jgi:hypothetical protein
MSTRIVLIVSRVLFALLTLGAILVQFRYSSGRPDFNPANFFSFFTIESNIFISIVFLATALLPSGREGSGTRDLVRGAATLYMATTGVVYVVLLSGLEESLQTQVPWVNLVLHYIMPVVAALDWVIDPPRQGIPFRRALIWLVFPAVYCAYSLVRGPFADWYPYAFLNPASAGGYGGVALTVLGISLGMFMLIWLLVWSARWRRATAGPVP